MTREEFISEVKSSNYNYPSFDEEYKASLWKAVFDAK